MQSSDSRNRRGDANGRDVNAARGDAVEGQPGAANPDRAELIVRPPVDAWHERNGTAGPPNLDAIALLRALQRRWLLALSLGLAAAGVVGATVWFLTMWLLPPQYTAFALLRVSLVAPVLVFRTHDTEQGANYQKTQLVLLKSPFVLSAALRPPISEKPCVQEKEDPVAWLTKELSVGYVQASEVLRIALTGKDPQDVADLVNAVKTAYMAEVVDDDRQKRLERLNQLEKAYAAAEKKVREKREQHQKLVGILKTSDPQALTLREKIETEEYAARRQENTQLHIQHLKLQAQANVEAAKAKADGQVEVPDSLIDQAIEMDPTIQQLKVRASKLKEQMANKRLAAADPNRIIGMAGLEKQQASIEEEINARSDELRPLVSENLVAKVRRSSEAALNDIQTRLVELVEQEKALNEDIERYKAVADRTGTTSAELEFLRLDINRENVQTHQISAELEALRVELGARPRVTELQPAEVPRSSDPSRQVKLTVLATIGSFGCVLLGVAFLETRAQRLTAPEEVTRRLGMRVVGSLPAIPDRSSRPWRGNGDHRKHMHAFFTESVDSIRTMLFRESRAGSLKIIMVTSAMGGEGKTTLSSHLATSLARGGKRTLLIDGDMRRPTTHTLFDLPLGPGFSDLMRGQKNPSEVVRPANLENLWIIPGGNGDHRLALEALAKDSAERLIKELSQDYDFVIIDSPPVLPVADSLVIGQWVDGVIFSMLHGSSQLPKVQAACQRVQMAGIRILGAVVGKARGGSYGYGYGSGSGSYQIVSPTGNGQDDDSSDA